MMEKRGELFDPDNYCKVKKLLEARELKELTDTETQMLMKQMVSSK